ncbi:MAG: hypothetical protein KDC38_02340 [Planctomycetes bacterium]|nr:hypothetical protein [Planctomycetota bacterium]
MNWLLATALLGLAFGESRPLLPVELEHLTLEPGQLVVVVGRYQSVVGNDLSLVGTDLAFELEEDARFPVLRSMDLRSLPLGIRFQVGDDPRDLRVIDAFEGPSDRTMLDLVSLSLEVVPVERRLAIARWALEHPVDSESEAFRKTSLGIVERILSDLASAEQKVVDPDQVLALLERHRAVLSTNELWQREVPKFADRFVSRTDEARERRLRELGFIFDREGWVSEFAFLAGIGMVRSGERVITNEQQALETRVDEWNDSGRRQSLLRGLTQQQYESYARKRQLHEGMSRVEALGAWGYPADVTWLQQRGTMFEFWEYRGRRLFLVDGLVFDWDED